MKEKVLQQQNVRCSTHKGAAHLQREQAEVDCDGFAQARRVVDGAALQQG